MTVIQCFAPTRDTEEEVKNSFYQQLQKEVDGTPRPDLLLVTEDLNEKGGE